MATSDVVGGYVSIFSYGMEANVMSIVAKTLGIVRTMRDARQREQSDLKQINDVLDHGYQGLMTAVIESMQNQGSEDDAWAQQWFDLIGLTMTPYDASHEIWSIYTDGIDRMQRDIASMIRTQAIGLRTPQGVLPFGDAYRVLVDQAVNTLNRGDMTRDQVVTQIVEMMADSGLQVQYASGNYRELYSAVETNVRDAFGSTMSQARLKRGEQFGADGIEISAHAQCAEDHLPYQGRQYSIAQYHMLNETLSRPIVTGANCRHRASPVILGLSVSTYNDKELKQMEQMSHKKVTFIGAGGKQLAKTTYEATQYMRNLELRIRKADTTATLLKNAKQDASSVEAIRDRLTDTWTQMQKDTKIRGREERTKAMVQSRY